MKAEVAALGSPSLTVLNVFADVSKATFDDDERCECHVVCVQSTLGHVCQPKTMRPVTDFASYTLLHDTAMDFVLICLFVSCS